MTVSLAKPLGLEFVENAAAWQKKITKTWVCSQRTDLYRVDIEIGYIYI